MKITDTENLDASTMPLIPIFAGIAGIGQYIILYRCGDERFLLRPDKELWALSPEAVITWGRSMPDDRIHLTIKSPEWSGTAIGSNAEAKAHMLIHGIRPYEKRDV